MTVGVKYTGRADWHSWIFRDYYLVFDAFFYLGRDFLELFYFCIHLIMPSCAVDGCKTRSDRVKNVSLFKFPKQEATRQAWIRFCARDTDIRFENAAICEKHFEEKEFRNTNLMKRSFGIPCRMFLRDGAIPTVPTTSLRWDCIKRPFVRV